VSAFPREAAARIVEAGLDEDLGAQGDITSAAVIPAGTRARAVLVARESLVVAGLPLCEVVYEDVAQRLRGPLGVTLLAVDGAEVPAGETLARFVGDAQVLLAGERLLLNLVARLSGIASLTAEAVAEISGTRARIADTRKTTPLLRVLEKYAVAVAGGENHRFGLFDQVLVKDNHKEVRGGIGAVLAALAAAGHPPESVEVEVDTLDELDAALAAGVGWILLDNMEPEQVRKAVRRAAGRARLEVSGGLRPGRLRAYAETGVDRLSLGRLTHGARSKDLALDIVYDRA
jgi:nicotinate-nucleotide pyrophosphorylase (carboxylating)